MAHHLKGYALPAVVYLQGSVTAKLFAHVGIKSQRVDAPVRTKVELEALIVTLTEINRAVSQIQRTYTPPGEHSKPVHQFPGHIALRRAQNGRCGRKGYSVFKIDAADTDWLEDMGITRIHYRLPFHYKL